mmetsp:Transcript_71484/g.213291  ORF Transcript_71484/g.213291 Transcript_71484/m.213291 type:complete len:394 (-) Transcript_71484:1149-2330(-)
MGTQGRGVSLLHLVLVLLLVLFLHWLLLGALRLLLLLGLLGLLLLLLLDVLLRVAVVSEAAQAHLEAPPWTRALERRRRLEEVALDAILFLDLHALLLLGGLRLRSGCHGRVGVLTLQQQLDFTVERLGVELRGVRLLDEAPQLHGPLAPPVGNALHDPVPVDALVGLSINTLTDDLALLVRSAMLQLESEVSSPSITKAGVQRDSSVEPLAGLCVLPISPEELGDGHDDVRVVLALLQRIHALGVLPLLWLELNGLGPHDATRRALLQRSAHQVVGKPLTAIQHLHLNTLQPEEVSTRIPQAALLEQRPCLGVALLPNLALHAAQPQRHAARAALQSPLEEPRGVVQLRRRLLHVDLAADHPHLRVGRVLLEALLAQVERLLEEALLSLQLH